jgi:hypothetical protein
MPDTFLLRDWQGFFTLVGTAAATLIGLIFLAFSLGARLVPAEDNTAMRAFVVPIVVHFGAVLVLAALMLVPLYTAASLGLVLLAGGLAGAVFSLQVLRQLKRHHFQEEALNLHHWTWHWILPSSGYALVVAAGLGVLAGLPGFVLALVPAALVLIIVGLRNAFDLFLWIARQTT